MASLRLNFIACSASLEFTINSVAVLFGEFTKEQGHEKSARTFIRQRLLAKY